MKYEILKKGRKWFEAVEPNKTFKVQIEINEISKDWEVGNIVDVHGEVKKNKLWIRYKSSDFPFFIRRS